MTEKNVPRRDPIVARRDGDLGEPTQAHNPDSFAGSDNDRRGNGKPGKAKTGSPLLLFVTLLLSICLGGLGWFSWQQSQAQALLQQRFDDLAAKIDSTDESLSQSGAALSVKLSDQQAELTKHWSEIRKLWGVANDRNKKAISAVEQSIAQSIKKRQKLEKTVSATGADQKKLTARLDELGSDSLATVARYDELDERVGRLSDSQQKVLQLVDQKQRGFESRLLDTEKAIKSIDAFRRQTNQSLDALRQVPAIP
ncbi:MAG: hypothetical protein KUG71_05080 [Porticoccaceae bacterium]|nr:hypothetical protein [Porticoccaceae bacterium]